MCPLRLSRTAVVADRAVPSGLAPLPLADEDSVGYRAASHSGADADAVLGMRIGSRDGATRAHRPGLSPVPLPRVRQAVQRALRHSLNRTQYPSDVIALVVLWRLRYK